MIQTEIFNQYETKLHDQILKVFHASGMKLHDNHTGCKKYTNYQRVALLVLFSRSGKALRNFINKLFESKWPRWLDLKDIPNFSTISRWFKKWDLQFLRNILSSTVANNKPSLMAVDATGFDSWQRSRHYERRMKQCGVHRKHDPYAKVDLLIDTRNKLIYDWVLRLKPRHDVLGFETMIKRLKYCDILILADRGYDSEPLHEIVARTGNLMYAPIRDFHVKKPRGKHRQRCSQGHEQYYQRNIVESINFSLKSRFRSLRNKLHYMKKREFAWKIITYNLEKLSQTTKTLIYLLTRVRFCNKPVFLALLQKV